MTEFAIRQPAPEPTKYFSIKAILLTTYLGGPLAAGILIRKNFINLGEKKTGDYALVISIVFTVLLFGVIFTIPEHITDKIPKLLIPAIYTSIVYVLVEKLQGPVLKAHKVLEGKFYSGWRAVGVGAVCLAVMVSGLLAYMFLFTNELDSDAYSSGYEQLTENEEKALELYSMMDTSSTDDLVKFIDETGIPLWQENIKILDKLDNFDGLTYDLKEQNEKFRKYFELRLKLYELMRKAIFHDTIAYNAEINAITRQIEAILQ